MNVLVAIDSMKGSLTSRQAAEAVRAGVLAACPDAAVETLPVADHYRAQEKCFEVNGFGTIDEVFDSITRVLEGLGK